MSKKNRPETVAADILDRSWPWMLALCGFIRVLSVRSRHGSTWVWALRGPIALSLNDGYRRYYAKLLCSSGALRPV